MENKEIKDKKNYKVYFKKLNENGVMPKKFDFHSVAYDLYVPDDIVVPAHSRFVVPLGISISLPIGIEAKIEPRSGYSAKGMNGFAIDVRTVKFLGIPYKKIVKQRRYFDADVITGKIDPGYIGEIGVILRNNDISFVIGKGTRIAQLTLYHFFNMEFKEVENLNGYDRGGGFGHSNTEEHDKDIC